MGASSPERWNPSPPLTKSRRGGRGAGTRGGHESARHRTFRGRSSARRGSASARRGSVWECCCGSDGRHSSVRRTLEEEEARLLHLEVSSVLPRHPKFRGARV
jgi:hypothetical protein